MRGKVSRAAAALREQKALVKKEIDKNRSMVSTIKDAHSEILALEEKVYWASGIIKEKRKEGLSPEESKRREAAKQEEAKN